MSRTAPPIVLSIANFLTALFFILFGVWCLWSLFRYVALHLNKLLDGIAKFWAAERILIALVIMGLSAFGGLLLFLLVASFMLCAAVVSLLARGLESSNETTKPFYGFGIGFVIAALIAFWFILGLSV